MSCMLEEVVQHGPMTCSLNLQVVVYSGEAKKTERKEEIVILLSSVISSLKLSTKTHRQSPSSAV